MSNRGVVSTASYEARKYGIHSAMPIFHAKRKCPQGIFIPVRMERYREVSRNIMHILDGFSPLVEQVSIDEAYMDITGTEKLLGQPETIGLKIKQEIRQIEQLTCSVGIAPNRFLAKIASDMHKPDGLTIISQDEALDFIQDINLKKVPGIGKKTTGILLQMGAIKLGDIHLIARHPRYQKLGKIGERILELANGVDETPVVTHGKAKSISSENTFPEDTNNQSVIKKYLLNQAEIVGSRLREQRLKGSTVTLKLKTCDFKQMTRSVTMAKPLNSSQAIYKEGLILLENIGCLSKFRLIGLAVSNLVNSDFKTSVRQMDLFQGSIEIDSNSHWEDAEGAMDAIKKRFGADAIKRGALIEKDPQIKKE
jgi:DNA polymerase-4